MSDDDFKPARAADVTDLELLPRRFEFFASATRDALSRIETSLGKLLKLAEHADHEARDAHARIVGISERTYALEKRVAELEPPPVVPIRRKARR